MRHSCDFTKTCDGRYEGSLTESGTAGHRTGHSSRLALRVSEAVTQVPFTLNRDAERIQKCLDSWRC